MSEFAEQILDVTDTSLDDWLSLLSAPPKDRIFVRNMFPTERHRDEFIATLPGRDEQQVKLVLRHFLVSSGSNLMDRVFAQGVQADLRSGRLRPPLREHDLRLAKHLISGWKYPVWEGLHWVLDLLPSQPRDALQVLNAFFNVRYSALTDNYLSGLFDAQQIIRQRYIVEPFGGDAARATILTLSPRDLEWLCGMLYQHMGFHVRVTPPSGDDGADVIATKEAPGRRERVVIQAKKYGTKNHIERDDMMHLLGVIDDQKATRGVLVTTGPIRRGARALQRKDARVEVIGLDGLLVLLAEHCGADWYTRVDRLLTFIKHYHFTTGADTT